MVTAHEQAVAARLCDVVGIVWRMVGSALGGLDIHEVDVLVTAHFGPVNISLMTGDVNTIVLGILAAGRYS